MNADLDQQNRDKLVREALLMSRRAHAPYSHYHVGAAVLLEDNTILGGCNVESSSYGLTCCAERAALYRNISENGKTVLALAVASSNGAFPCGACRQVIWDLCGDIPIYVADENGAVEMTTSGALLPQAFSSKDL